jgi:hypothetical protein
MKSDYVIVGLIWLLAVVVIAIRRWRIRVYLAREIVRVMKSPEFKAGPVVTLLIDPPSQSSRLVSEGGPVGANEAKDSSQREVRWHV